MDNDSISLLGRGYGGRLLVKEIEHSLSTIKRNIEHGMGGHKLVIGLPDDAFQYCILPPRHGVRVRSRHSLLGLLCRFVRTFDDIERVVQSDWNEI